MGSGWGWFTETVPASLRHLNSLPEQRKAKLGKKGGWKDVRLQRGFAYAPNAELDILHHMSIVLGWILGCPDRRYWHSWNRYRPHRSRSTQCEDHRQATFFRLVPYGANRNGW